MEMIIVEANNFECLMNRVMKTSKSPIYLDVLFLEELRAVRRFADADNIGNLSLFEFLEINRRTEKQVDFGSNFSVWEKLKLNR